MSAIVWMLVTRGAQQGWLVVYDASRSRMPSAARLRGGQLGLGRSRATSARRGAGAVRTPSTASRSESGVTDVPARPGTTTGWPSPDAERRVARGPAHAVGAVAEGLLQPPRRPARGTSAPSASGSSTRARAIAFGGTTSSLAARRPASPARPRPARPPRGRRSPRPPAWCARASSRPAARPARRRSQPSDDGVRRLVQRHLAALLGQHRHGLERRRSRRSPRAAARRTGAVAALERGTQPGAVHGRHRLDLALGPDQGAQPVDRAGRRGLLDGRGDVDARARPRRGRA